MRDLEVDLHLKLVNKKTTFTCHDPPRSVLVVEVLNISTSETSIHPPYSELFESLNESQSLLPGPSSQHGRRRVALR